MPADRRLYDSSSLVTPPEPEADAMTNNVETVDVDFGGESIMDRLIRMKKEMEADPRWPAMRCAQRAAKTIGLWDVAALATANNLTAMRFLVAENDERLKAGLPSRISRETFVVFKDRALADPKGRAMLEEV